MIHANENTGLNNKLIAMQNNAASQAGHGNQAVDVNLSNKWKFNNASMHMYILSPIPDKFNALKSYG